MKTFLSLSFSLFFTLVAFTSFAQLKVLADGRVGIGTTNPQKKLDVIGVMALQNNEGVNTDKQSNFQMRTYLNSGTFFNYFLAQTTQLENIVVFGGGAGSQNAATTMSFHTTSLPTNVGAGTERMRIASNGFIRMNSAGNAGGLTHDLTLITGDASKPGGGSWATPSDARIKTGVHAFTDGLEKVLQINPVYFKYKPETGYPSDKEYVGVIAQEIQKVAPYTVEERKVIIQNDDKTTKLPETILTYQSNAVTYMLINAVKEQQAMITAQDRKIEELEDKLSRIEHALSFNDGSVPNVDNNTSITLEGIDGAYLKQNAPNPFGENTSIEYSLPKNFNTAYIQIYNAQGVMMRKVDLPKTSGIGILNIKARELAAGDYVYTLIVDGKIIDTKKMILSNN